jgi:hypothetical protein
MYQKQFFARLTLLLTLLTVLIVALPFTASAQAGPGAMVYAITTGNNLVSFNSADPSTVMTTVPVTGLQPGESILKIDFRPANGTLFALSDAGRIYSINTGTGTATAAGSAPIAVTGSAFGFDFNPTVDRIRLTSNDGQNLRLNPNNGGLAATDKPLVYADTDDNAGRAPNIVASAYTNNAAGVSSTTLYNIDANLNTLVRQAPPNDGILNTVGSLGVDVGSVSGFDILGNTAAFAVINSSLYTIDLNSGAASLVGRIGGGEGIRDIALAVSSIPAARRDAACDQLVGANSVARIAGSGVFCRVLVQNTVFTGTGAEIGSQAVIDRGIVQAVDVFAIQNGTGTPTLSAPVSVCLLGAGRLIYLDATTSPRTPVDLAASFDGAYTCGSISNAGTVALVRG